jgi:hypothetical protein
MNDVSKEQKMASLFLNLVQQFYQSALIYMGKIENPQTKKIEINKDMARYFIDSLEMLIEKTQNNLSDHEAQMLTKIVQELKLEFVKVNK